MVDMEYIFCWIAKNKVKIRESVPDPTDPYGK